MSSAATSQISLSHLPNKWFPLSGMSSDVNEYLSGQVSWWIALAKLAARRKRSHSHSTHRTWNAHNSYLVEYVIAFPARGELQQLVQTFGGKIDQNVPAAVIIAFTWQAHHLITTARWQTYRYLPFYTISPSFRHVYSLLHGSANFLGPRAGWAPKELAAGRTGKFYMKNLITVD